MTKSDKKEIKKYKHNDKKEKNNAIKHEKKDTKKIKKHKHESDSDSDASSSSSESSAKHKSFDENSTNLSGMSNNTKKKIEDAFIDKVIKYIGTDNLIRDETKEFKEKMITLKKEKQQLEKYIITYLENKHEEQINIDNNCKLTLVESSRKMAVNKNIIQNSIVEQLKKCNLIQNDDECQEFIESVYDTMEDKRETKIRTYLKRTFSKKNAKK